MRTNLFLLAGFLLLTSTRITGKLLSDVFPSALNWATILFVLVWLALAGANLIGGVTRAGYTVGEELPIFSVDLRVTRDRHAHRSLEVPVSGATGVPIQTYRSGLYMFT